MGAEQSNAETRDLRSRRDEDLPFTSYQLGNPIDTDSSRSSPSLATKLKKQVTKTESKLPAHRDASSNSSHQHHEVLEKSHEQEPSTVLPSAHRIVTVTEAKPCQDEDLELQKLEAVPVFLPILRGALNIPTIQDSNCVEKMDHTNLLSLCTRYQDHLKQCAEAVNFDQNNLATLIKKLDESITTTYSAYIERQKKFSKYSEQIQKISEIQRILSKVETNLQQTLPLLEHLNTLLPPEEQLESFSFTDLSCT